MQLSLDTGILTTLLTRATSASQLIGDIERDTATVAVGTISASLDEIVHTLSGLLRDQQAADGGGGDAPSATLDAGMQFDVANAVDDLRQLLAKADALAHAAEDLFDNVIRVDDAEDRRRLERVAHLVGATAEAVGIAVDAGDQLAADLSALPRPRG